MGNKCLDVRTKQQSTQDIILQLKIQTWNKEAHHLFDYSTSNLKKEEILTIHQNGLIVKAENSFRVITNYEQYKGLDKKKIQFSIDVNKYDQYFQIMKNIYKDDGYSLNNIWQVINKDTKIQLQLNDVFKLGRLRFKVVDIVLQETIQISTFPSVSNKQKLIKENNMNTCKICYQKQIDSSNPLISPCGCIGSVKYIHLNCLRQWLQKISDIRRTDSSLEVPLKEHKCQLCDKIIEQNLQHEGQKLFTYYSQTKLLPPYIKLFLLSKQQKRPKSIYIYSFKNCSQVTIGRGSASGIRIRDDISISRQHSLLSFQNGKIYLSDYKSKFGTIKLLKNSLKFSYAKQINNEYIQMNNHLFSIQIKSKMGRPNLNERKRTQQQLDKILNQKPQIVGDDLQSNASQIEQQVMIENEQN